RSAERGTVSEGLKRRQLVVIQPRGGHERPAEAVIRGERPGHLPGIAKVKLYVAPARIADGVFIVLVDAPQRVLYDRVRPLIAARGTPAPKPWQSGSATSASNLGPVAGNVTSRAPHSAGLLALFLVLGVLVIK